MRILHNYTKTGKLAIFRYNNRKDLKSFWEFMFKKIVISLFIIFWCVMAINPHDRTIWLAENLLLFIMFPTVLWLDYRFSFSNAAFGGLFIFGLLHAIGAHFTYTYFPHIPLLDFVFETKRSYYDRIVHFAYGIFTFVPFFEIFYHSKNPKKLSYLIAFLFVLSVAALYEILEWLAIKVSHPEDGSFLITQGDEWDAQKDMGCAILGSLVAFGIHIFIKREKLIKN